LPCGDPEIKILDITGIYPHPGHDSEGRSVAGLTDALSRRGYSVLVAVMKPWVPRGLASRRKGWRHLAVRGGEGTSGAGARVRFLRYPHLPSIFGERRIGRNAATMARSVWAWCRRAAFTPSVVHAEGLPMAPVAAAVAGRLGVPWAVTLRDDLGHVLKLDAPGRSFHRKLLGGAGAVFAIGPAQVRDMAALFEGGTPPVIRAPNGIDVEGVRREISTLGRNPGPHGRIVSVANLYRWKGIHENLHAMRRLLDEGISAWTYVVVGDGPYREELKEMAVDFGLGDRVTFKGALPHRDALAEMRQADIFCLPSWMEAFGNVFLEAGLCGLPAIGCRQNGPEWIIRDDKTGLLVPPRDVEALAKALASLLGDPERSCRMGREASSVAAEFTWEKTASIVEKGLSEVRVD
jgi:teichuronic acid biosynthesis glycosyltransferase TuaC